MKHLVYLALGSNLGDRLANLQHTVAALAPQLVVKDQSHMYETEPWGYTDQPAFLNMAVKAETDLPPEALLTFLKKLEQDLGREPTPQQYGPRKIDLDILFYDDIVLNTPPLVIPHPRLHERAFVLIPLADIAPDHIHPVIGDLVWDMLAGVDIRGIHRFVPTE